MKNRTPQGDYSEGLQTAPMQPASPAFFEHHSQKTFCESVRFFANNVPVCRIVIETVTKALKRIKLFFFGIYIKKITKKFHFPKEFLQEYSIG